MADWLNLRRDWPWESVARLQEQGVVLVEDGNHGEYRPRPEEFSDDGTAFIRAADLLHGQVSFATAGQINDVALKRIRKGIGRPGDILFSHKGTVGKLARVQDDAPPFVCSPQTTFWRVLDPLRLDRVFLYAYMRSPEFYRQWVVRKGDTDMADYVSLTAQRTLLVPMPPLPVQRRIGSFLSAYDQLVENNSRRIHVLDQMARRIYNEWFIDYRYPGHQDRALLHSELGPIPQEWSVCTLDEVCSRITDGAHHSPASTEEGMPMASVKDMSHYGLDLSSCRLISSGDYEVLRRQGCKPAVGDILVSKDGAKYLEKVFTVQADEDVVLLSSIAILRPGPTMYSSFASESLRNEAVKERLRRHVSGAAIPRIVLKDFKAFQLVVPPLQLQSKWDDIAGSMRRLASTLERSNRSLEAARNQLLPRLISGERWT